ncbi:SDR family NAD(P)-dependent oxidoreductase [Cryobacterium suzukii]|uniref:SDR family NAD(P)-dependent oxidoreductase n=1 Tax=Cryobacterium suzukii TaxID=1259198 RepID=UPI00141BBC44|nr:SDR family oxidoreductase [Cryobacterium suzukii]
MNPDLRQLVRGTLEGKRVLITGAGRGLGRSYALHLARAGADVAVTDLSLHSFREYEAEAALMRGDTVVSELHDIGVQALGYEVDATDEEAMKGVVDSIQTAWGGLDVLVNNVGGGSYSQGLDTRPSTLPIRDLRDNFERNLVSTVIACQLAIPIMGSGASIINIGSQAGEAATEAMYSAYGSAKAAVAHYSRFLANELGPRGIRVNVVAPGYIATGRLSKVFAEVGEKSVENRIALGRIGTPEDCASAIEFLAGEGSRYITSQTLKVDGGSLNFATSRQ